MTFSDIQGQLRINFSAFVKNVDVIWFFMYFKLRWKKNDLPVFTPGGLKVCHKNPGILADSGKFCFLGKNYFFRDSSTATATETVIPTMGLLPAPRKPWTPVGKEEISLKTIILPKYDRLQFV